MAISNIAVGRHLQNRRKEKGLKQLYVAEVLDISVEHLSRVETGKAMLSLDKLAEYCDLLGISMVQVIAEAETTDHPEYALRFAQIIRDCPAQAVEMMLSACDGMARHVRESREEPEG
ncbi:MAG TPA: helix-turn-helix transcriptional regulator [Candidatus Ventricola intestinavium]|nr:helix-turn-helix transcriptional regulator [Candidatus Ventricola intestinavium]